MSFLDRLRGRKKGEGQSHQAAVYYVTVPDVEPYYVAICECDWLGDTHSTQEPAFEDARKHTPMVQEEIQLRP